MYVSTLNEEESKMRELTLNEVEEVSGGVWPIVMVGAGFGTGIGISYWINH